MLIRRLEFKGFKMIFVTSQVVGIQDSNEKNIVLLNAKGATLISKSDPISQTLVRNSTKETSPQYI